MIRSRILLALLAVEITSAAQDPPGIIVDELTTGSIASKARLQAGDRILAYDGKPLASPAALDALEENISLKKDVALEVVRRGQKLKLIVAAGKLGASFRPELSPEVTRLYGEGKALVSADRSNDTAIDRWAAAAQTAARNGDRVGAAWLYRHIGDLRESQSQWKQACQADMAAWGLLQRESDRSAQSRTLLALGRCSRGQNELHAAQKWFAQAREADEAADNELWLAEDLNSLGTVAENRGNLASAHAYLSRALSIRERFEPGSLDVAASLNDLGNVARKQGDLRGAEGYLKRALAICEQIAPHSSNLAWVLNSLGNLAWVRGDLTAAHDYYSRALAIHEQIAPSSVDVAGSLDNLGIVAGERGDQATAQEYHSRALEILELLAPNSLKLANVLDNLGVVAQELGESEAAKHYHFRALAIRGRLAPNSLETATTLTNLGNVEQDQGDLPAAHNYHTRALTIFRRLAPNSLDVAFALDNLGNVAVARDDMAAAQVYFRGALAIRERIAPESLDTAESLNNLGVILLLRGDLETAQNNLDRALKIRERLAPDSNRVAETLAQLGDLAWKKHNLSGARSLYTRSVVILEAQRGRIPSADARALMVAKFGSAYAQLVQVCTALNDLPAAFSASERSRARSLMDLLNESRIDVREGVDASLQQQERSLRQLLNTKADSQTRLLSEKHTQQQSDAAAKEIDALTTEYHEVEAKIRSSNPHYSALAQPLPLTVEEIQREVLEDGSLLLEYSLGEEASTLFVVSQNTIKCYRLPKRAEIEAVARQTYELLTARNRFKVGESIAERNARVLEAEAQYPKLAARLSRMILAPAAEQFGDKRLVIVADGALLQIPFAALPDPSASSIQPLLLKHELVSLPSASVLAIQRRELASRKPPPRQLAVFADPVFEKNDERVKAVTTPPTRVETTANSKLRSFDVSPDAPGTEPGGEDLARALREVRIGGERSKIQRLPFSREEANSIMGFAEHGNNLLALDFDASKKAVVDADLSQYRIVHFATHALLNNDHPDLTGIVLSLVDPGGKHIDGFLRLNEIYNLHLPADLVVLSACQTGLGKEIKGEGLMGLTRGFLYAGAERVVASLWNVDDEATAELMAIFYRKLLQDRRPLPVSLREAQKEMSRHKRWSSAYFWAGFEMQGEWKPLRRCSKE